MLEVGHCSSLFPVTKHTGYNGIPDDWEDETLIEEFIKKPCRLNNLAQRSHEQSE